MIKRFRSILVLATLALSACSTGAPEFSIRFDSFDLAAAYEKGRSQYEAGQFGLAIQSFERAVAASPNSVDALNGLGAAHDKIGRFDLARRHYERALTLDPGSVQTLNNLGYSYYLEGRYDLAAVYLEDAYWLSQENPQVRGNRSLIEEAAGKAPEPLQSSVLPAAEPEEDADVKPPLEIIRISRQEQALVKTAYLGGDTAITDVLARTVADKSRVRHGAVRLPKEPRDVQRRETDAAARQNVDEPVSALPERHTPPLPMRSVIRRPLSPPAKFVKYTVTPAPPAQDPKPTSPARQLVQANDAAPTVDALRRPFPLPVASGPPISLVSAPRSPFGGTGTVTAWEAQQSTPSSRIPPSRFWLDTTQIAASGSTGNPAGKSYW